MASTCYNSTIFDALTGAIDFNTDTFYVMLVGASYTPDVDLHTKRSNITGEVTGAGYTAGGQAVACSVTQDNVNNRTSLVFASVSWPNSTLASVEGAVYYKRRGGLDTADELVLFDDFVSPAATSGTTFTLGASTILYNTPV